MTVRGDVRGIDAQTLNPKSNPMHQPPNADERRTTGLSSAGETAPAPTPPADASAAACVRVAQPGGLKSSLLWASLAGLLCIAAAVIRLDGRVRTVESQSAECIARARRAAEWGRPSEPAPAATPRAGDVAPAERILTVAPALTPPTKPLTPKKRAPARRAVLPAQRPGDRSRRTS